MKSVNFFEAFTVNVPSLKFIFHIVHSFHFLADLKSIMLEYSDLSAPKKAKGFHKPTLNEVQKSGQRHHKVSTLNIHESDHSRSWKQNTDDLEGLFQIPGM